MLQANREKNLGDYLDVFPAECERDCKACNLLHPWRGSKRGRKCVQCGRFGASYYFSLAGWGGFFAERYAGFGSVALLTCEACCVSLVRVSGLPGSVHLPHGRPVKAGLA
jgi:hypothetical protein